MLPSVASVVMQGVDKDPTMAEVMHRRQACQARTTTRTEDDRDHTHSRLSSLPLPLSLGVPPFDSDPMVLAP